MLSLQALCPWSCVFMRFVGAQAVMGHVVWIWCVMSLRSSQAQLFSVTTGHTWTTELLRGWRHNPRSLTVGFQSWQNDEGSLWKPAVSPCRPSAGKFSLLEATENIFEKFIILLTCYHVKPAGLWSDEMIKEWKASERRCSAEDPQELLTCRNANPSHYSHNSNGDTKSN